MEKLSAEGLLFIGDPHQDSKTPGRRLDEKFYETVSNKIAQAVKIAEEGRLIPVFLGDFFNREDDMDPTMLVSTINALKTSGHKPWTLVGNHEKKRTVLTDDTALSVLLAAQVMKRVPQQGPAFILEAPKIGGGFHLVGVGGSGYDQEVPKDVSNLFEDVEDVVWLTHHDWLFESGYPNAQIPFEIKGCSTLVNGHIHLTKTPRRAGKTTYWNPGNITRMSIDAYNHVPRVWVYRPGHPKLHPIALEFEKELFDWTGKVASAVPESLVKDPTGSAFVSLMAQEMNDLERKTQDGTNFLERLSGFCEENKLPGAVQERLAHLFQEVRYEKK